jgi:hypothetical protein
MALLLHCLECALNLQNFSQFVMYAIDFAGGITLQTILRENREKRLAEGVHEHARRDEGFS